MSSKRTFEETSSWENDWRQFFTLKLILPLQGEHVEAALKHFEEKQFAVQELDGMDDPNYLRDTRQLFVPKDPSKSDESISEELRRVHLALFYFLLQKKHKKQKLLEEQARLFQKEREQEKEFEESWESYLSESRNDLIKKGLPPKRILSYNGEETMVFETTNNFVVKIKQRRRNDYEGTILFILDGKERTIKLIETFQTEGEETALVFKQYQGESSKWKPTNQKELHTFIVHLIQAVRYCHSKSILHGDITPCNVLYETDEEGNYSFVLSDFGISFELDEEAIGIYELGTFPYMAPEVLKPTMGPLRAIDIWSTAIVILEKEMGNRLLTGNYNSKDEVWKDLEKLNLEEVLQQSSMDHNLKDLLLKMLIFDQTRRITADEAWNHPYINKGK